MQQTQMKIHGVRRKKSGSSRTSGLCQLPLATALVTSRLREIRRKTKWDARRETERLKLAKRQEVVKAKERESALRSRREQLVKGALNLALSEL
jgi:hypothetical protein